MMSKVASNARLLMLYTSMSAQGESSPVLWSLKSSVPLPVSQDPKREHRRSQGVWNQRFHCSVFTMYWTVCCKEAVGAKSTGLSQETWVRPCLCQFLGLVVVVVETPAYWVFTMCRMWCEASNSRHSLLQDYVKDMCMLRLGWMLRKWELVWDKLRSQSMVGLGNQVK